MIKISDFKMKKKVTPDEEFLFKNLFLHIEKHLELYHFIADDEIERYNKAYKAFMKKNFGETYDQYSSRRLRETIMNL